MAILQTATAVLTTVLCTAATAIDPADQAAIDFFEQRIRPLLVENCLKCHGPKRQESGFRVDSRPALLRGGKRGAAVVSGVPDESLLVKAIQRRGKLKMPPKQPLKASEIADLERWIERGAVWPADSPGKTSDRNRRIAQLRDSHWSFRPIENPRLPTVENPSWVRNPIDTFVLARLEREGLTPSPEADRRTLARRLYFDLIGLPPEFDAVRSFAADESPNAVAKLVLDLLQRPEYGERWARHWLDVARYSDTTGYQESAEPIYPFSWTYRDYVVRSLNEDTSFDQFILEQLAADQLDLAAPQRWKLAAMGFLTLGPRFNYVRHEIIDDRIDVVTRGLLGLSVTCSRCHDHKYDPILSEDYYGFYGVLASSREPLYSDLPRLGPPRGSLARYREFRKKVAKATRRFEQFHARTHKQIQREMRSITGEYLRYLVQLMPEHRTVAQPSFDTARGRIRGPTPYGPGGVVRWQHYIESRGESDPVFGLWNRLAQLTREELLERIDPKIASATETNPVLLEAIRGGSPASMIELAGVYGRVLERTHANWEELTRNDPELRRFADGETEQLRAVLYDRDSPISMNPEEAHDCYTDGEFNQYMGLKRELDSLFVEYQDVSEPRAMVLVDRLQPEQPRLFARGNSTRPGPFVTRRFLRVLDHVDGGKRFAIGSGRLELARAIIHPDNPLTARVIVNRVWQWHFGRGLVDTASDFGTRGDRPSHPKLLDWLASDFRNNGWSLKRLHRLIVSSATYRQSSLEPDFDRRYQAQGDGAANGTERDPRRIDPDNRLLWRMNRRRLSFEALRDSMLAMSGQLKPRSASGRDPTTYQGRGGRPQRDLTSQRRSLYLMIDRHDLSPTLATFDFPSPDISSSRRSETTVPPQALFLMNSAFALTIAAKMVERMEAAELNSTQDRIRWLYHRTLSRDPRDLELRFCENILRESRWHDLAQVLLMSNEFTFVD